MEGKILVYLTFAFSVLSGIMYFASYYKDSIKPVFGRVLYYLTTAGVIGTSMFLLSNILQHNFQYTYIWEYSSRELPENFLVATFYSGQQGSFLLWGLMMALVGFFLMPYSQKHKYETITIGLFAFIVAFVFLILIFKSPFDFVWETYKGEVAEGFTPANGRGLNPILQNYWITIHPPILFIGYSLMTVPYVFAIAGLIKKEYKNWINVSLPWTLAASGVLGLGLMLGGFWAYETLGWGGFWAWDPVENSSLIPWLIGVTLVHTMLVHKKTGGLIKTNFVLSISTFLLVLYATFLTRSGVLGDTSVHSFVSPGAIIYNMLLVFMGVFLIVALVSLFMNLNKIPNTKINFGSYSKEFYLSLGSIVLILITFIVLFGTSWPIFAELLGFEKSSVEAKWYNMLNLPLGILIMFLNAYTLKLQWRQKVAGNVFKKIAMPTILGVLAAVASTTVGVYGVDYLLTVFAATFSILLNIEFIVNSLRKNPKMVGAFMSHTGIAFLILGALASGGFSDAKQIRLKFGESTEALGYKFTLLKKEQIEKHWNDREKFKYHLQVEKDGEKSVIHPIIYFSDFNQRQAPFFEPGIKTFPNLDVYASPYSSELTYDYPPLFLTKGDAQMAPFDEKFRVQLIRFDMQSALQNMDSTSNVLKIASIVRFSTKDFVSEDTVWSHLDMSTGRSIPEWKDFPTTNFQIGFMELIPNKDELSKSQAVFAFKVKGKELGAPKELFTMEVSTKPFINLVWFGTIICVLGFFISIFKYKNTAIFAKVEEEADVQITEVKEETDLENTDKNQEANEKKENEI